MKKLGRQGNSDSLPVSAGTGEGSEQEMTRPDFVKDGFSGSTCGGNEVINTRLGVGEGTPARCDCGLVTWLCAPSREIPRPGSAPSSWPGVPGRGEGQQTGFKGHRPPLGGSLGAGAASLVLPQDSGGTSWAPQLVWPLGSPSSGFCCHCLISDFLSPNPLPTPESPNTHTSSSELILTSLPVQEPRVGTGTPAGAGHPGGRMERARWRGTGSSVCSQVGGEHGGWDGFTRCCQQALVGVGWEEGSPVLPGGLSRVVEADGSPDGGTGEAGRTCPGQHRSVRGHPWSTCASLVLTVKPEWQTEMGALKGGREGVQGAGPRGLPGLRGQEGSLPGLELTRAGFSASA